MTNFEYHKEEIKNFLLEHGDTNFAVVNDKVVDCYKANYCFKCLFYKTSERCWDLRQEWLNAEHDPYSIPIDTPIDTKVLVSYDGKNWEKRYFSHFCKDEQYPYVCFGDGRAYWNSTYLCSWKYCKLWKGE